MLNHNSETINSIKTEGHLIYTENLTGKLQNSSYLNRALKSSAIRLGSIYILLSFRVLYRIRGKRFNSYPDTFTQERDTNFSSSLQQSQQCPFNFHFAFQMVSKSINVEQLYDMRRFHTNNISSKPPLIDKIFRDNDQKSSWVTIILDRL